jgi:hypothetical protein
VETIGHFPPFGGNYYRTLSTIRWKLLVTSAGDPPHKKVSKKSHLCTLRHAKCTQKKRLATMLIATPDEILWKGLEMGAFNHRWQQSAQHKAMAEKKKNEKSKTST